MSHHLVVPRRTMLALCAIFVSTGATGQSQPRDEWVRASLEDGRFQVSMPGKPFSTYVLNTSNQIYTGSNVLVSLAAVRYAEQGAADAAKDPTDFLRRFCNGVMRSWRGMDESFTELPDSDYPAIEHRFQHEGPSPPAGYFTHRAYYVRGQICSVFIDVRKEDFKADREKTAAIVAKYFDSLVIDRKRPPVKPFAHADSDRAKWPDPTQRVRQRIATAHGMLEDQFAFCQTMDLNDFHWLAAELRPSGYRPITFRPYLVEEDVKVAAVWTRDGNPWMLASGQQAGQIEVLNAGVGKDYSPVDVAGWEVGSRLHYGALWRKFVSRRGVNLLIVGASDSELNEQGRQVAKAGYRTRRRQRVLGTDGSYRHNNIVYKPRQNAGLRHIKGDRSFYERELKKKQVPYDISLCPTKQNDVFYMASFSNAKKSYKESHGLTPEDHLQRCQQFAASGLRPIALSVTHRPDKGYETASIWHNTIAEP